MQIYSKRKARLSYAVGSKKTDSADKEYLDFLKEVQEATKENQNG